MIKTKIAAIITATILVAGALYIGSSALVTASEDGLPGELPRIVTCDRGAGIVQHWDKIVFTSKKGVFIAGADGVIQEILDKKAIMDIKVIDDPNRIELPMQKAADKVNSVGWITNQGMDFTPNDLKLVDIEYAIVCVDRGPIILPPKL